MNKNIRMLEILCIISILVSIIFISSTYAKYVEQMNTDYEIGIKRWLIKINNKEVRSQQTLTDMVSPTIVSDENTSSNVIVPGTELYFDVLIDYEEVDVDFKMDFSIENKTSQFTDLVLMGYKEVKNALEGDLVPAEGEKISLTINLENETSKTKMIRIYYKWNDEDNNTMSNSQDTYFETNNESIKYVATVTFTQHNI